MTFGLEDVAENLRATSEGITRSLGLVASDLSIARHQIDNDMKVMREEIDRLQNRLDETKKALETSERNKERFRYALWVYLQERDGDNGVHAPTPETLTLIRELIKELQ